MKENKCYSKEDLNIFRSLLNEKLESANAELVLLKNEVKGVQNENDTADTFKPFDKDQREEDIAPKFKAIAKQKKYIIDLTNALVRIDNGHYGFCNCQVCQGKLIPKERLNAVPHATKCAEEKIRIHQN